MKRTMEVLAALLFVSALALGQQDQPLPFPQAANTALAHATAENTSAAVVPSTMAARQGSTAQAADVSPLPVAVNPSFGKGWDAMIGHSTADGGSPFPSVANPAARQ